MCSRGLGQQAIDDVQEQGVDTKMPPRSRRGGVMPSGQQGFHQFEDLFVGGQNPMAHRRSGEPDGNEVDRVESPRCLPYVARNLFIFVIPHGLARYDPLEGARTALLNVPFDNDMDEVSRQGERLEHAGGGASHPIDQDDALNDGAIERRMDCRVAC